MKKPGSLLLLLATLCFMMNSTSCDENNNTMDPLLGEPEECPCFTEEEVKDSVDKFAQEFRACVVGTDEIGIALPDNNNFTVVCKGFEYNTAKCYCNKNQVDEMDMKNQMALSEDGYDSCSKILEKVIEEDISGPGECMQAAE